MRNTNYFQYFNTTTGSDNSTIITNLLNRANIYNMNVLLNSKIFIPYFIKDGDRPETIAETYYGSTAYFWIILIANNIKNIYEDWPRTQEAFDLYIEDKYFSLEYATSAIHHYEDSDGDWVQNPNKVGAWPNTFITPPTAISIYEYEHDLNQNKRIINLIKNDYKSQIVKEFQNIFK